MRPKRSRVRHRSICVRRSTDALAGTKADASGLEREALAQARERHEIVAVLGVLTRPGDCRLTQPKIGVAAPIAPL